MCNSVSSAPLKLKNLVPLRGLRRLSLQGLRVEPLPDRIPLRLPSLQALNVVGASAAGASGGIVALHIICGHPEGLREAAVDLSELLWNEYRALRQPQMSSLTKLMVCASRSDESGVVSEVSSVLACCMSALNTLVLIGFKSATIDKDIASLAALPALRRVVVSRTAVTPFIAQRCAVLPFLVSFEYAVSFSAW